MTRGHGAAQRYILRQLPADGYVSAERLADAWLGDRAELYRAMVKLSRRDLVELAERGDALLLRRRGPAMAERGGGANHHQRNPMQYPLLAREARPWRPMKRYDP